MDERDRGLDRRQPLLQDHRGEESLEATHGTQRVVRPGNWIEPTENWVQIEIYWPALAFNCDRGEVQEGWSGDSPQTVIPSA